MEWQAILSVLVLIAISAIAISIKCSHMGLSDMDMTGMLETNSIFRV